MFFSCSSTAQHLTKSYLAVYLNYLKGLAWSIFVVRGNFPLISLSESFNPSGKWVSPEDAERINKFCNSGHQAPQERVVERQQHSNKILSDEEDEIFSNIEYDMFPDMEDEDLNAAIAASVMDLDPDEFRALTSSGGESIRLAAIAASRSSTSMSENISYSMSENISSSSSETN
ncbi:hypothetical protein P8452_31434 [Trifolium repens]|nr:ataxin-3 protein [Trifolium repens]WJX44462.1 hypothetical protein P8452_31434 [Trifolium repens]